MAAALAELGCERALVVSGRDGLDELSTGALTDVVDVRGPRWCASTMVDPAALGFSRARGRRIPAATRRRTPRCSSRCWAARAGPPRDVVVLNAAAAIWLAGRAPSLAAGAAAGRGEHRRGRRRERLDAFARPPRRLAAAG